MKAFLIALVFINISLICRAERLFVRSVGGDPHIVEIKIHEYKDYKQTIVMEDSYVVREGVKTSDIFQIEKGQFLNVTVTSLEKTEDIGNMITLVLYFKTHDVSATFFGYGSLNAAIREEDFDSAYSRFIEFDKTQKKK
jgi:hypothetical protein